MCVKKAVQASRDFAEVFDCTPLVAPSRDWFLDGHSAPCVLNDASPLSVLAPLAPATWE